MQTKMVGFSDLTENILGKKLHTKGVKWSITYTKQDFSRIFFIRNYSSLKTLITTESSHEHFPGSASLRTVSLRWTQNHSCSELEIISNPSF